MQRFPSTTFGFMLQYDFAPIVTKYTQEKETFINFIVQVCAIVGGVFTVAEIVDRLFHRSMQLIMQKARLGKLN